jgi:hypothetical protein
MTGAAAAFGQRRAMNSGTPGIPSPSGLSNLAQAPSERGRREGPAPRAVELPAPLSARSIRPIICL